MTNYLADLTDDLFECEIPDETIGLSEILLAQSLELSAQVAEPRKWQIYLQALALFSFEEWLYKREPSIVIHQEQASVFQPQYANFIDAVCNLRVGEYKVCLIPTISFSDEEILIPRAAVDIPEFAAHFYVVIGIDEELELAGIRGFLRYDELVTYQLQVQLDGNYQLTGDFLNREVDDLLLYLQCLEATAIPLPEIPHNRQVNHLSDLLQLVTQQAVNVRGWLNNQIDEITQELFWQVLPPLFSFRDEVDELEAILEEIRREYNIEIPENASRAYRDILIDNPLRLFAVIWQLADAENGWRLLLLIKAMTGNSPLYGITLRVSDRTEILVEEQLQPNSHHDYIFTLVEGSYEDRFIATMTTVNGEIYTLPPFEFLRD